MLRTAQHEGDKQRDWRILYALHIRIVIASNSANACNTMFNDLIKSSPLCNIAINKNVIDLINFLVANKGFGFSRSLINLTLLLNYLISHVEKILRLSRILYFECKTLKFSQTSSLKYFRCRNCNNSFNWTRSNPSIGTLDACIYCIFRKFNFYSADIKKNQINVEVRDVYRKKFIQIS